MKKILSLLLLIVVLSSCQAQNSSILVGQKVITDLSDYPVQNWIVEEVDGVKVLKKEYEYVNDIDMSVIRYMSDGLKISGLVVKPKRAGSYPCIIYNRGGNRDVGSLKLFDAVMRLGKLASQGYVVIASDYRGGKMNEGNDEFGGKDINDVLILPEVLAEIEGADTTKIGMYGWSRGGMMTFLALPQMKNLKAAVTGGAHSDLTIIDRQEMEDGVYAELIPNYWENKEEELKKRSGLYLVDKFPKDVPVLLLHGNADWRVKSENSLKMAMEFEKFRIPYKLVILEGGDHGLREHRGEVDQQVIDWFDKYLKGNTALPNMEYHGR